MKQKITGVLIALLFLFAYVSFTPDSSLYDDYTKWQQYGGGPDQSRYFKGSQITKKNVNKLQVAWVYPTTDSVPNFFSPIVVDTIMYVMAKNYSLVAINALTGKEIWIHANLQGLTRRGINYWESKDRKDRRLLFTLNNSLQAIDALTGKSILTFGTDGYVDMREGLDREVASIRRIQPMMPGVVYDNLIIMGSAPGEGYFSPPGHVRAYNVVTGKQEWIFHTIPHPGEFGYETWPKDAYKYVGAVNVWSEISVDVKRGIAYLPLGSPTYDYYGADRLGSNLFGNSLVALDARTGKRLWHFQTVHHDLWDYDLASAPQLITVKHKGKRIDAVAAATKHGFMFVFDRVTGEPIFPIEEKPFPTSEMPGEQAWPTQPIPTVVSSFTRHEVTKETLNPYYSQAEKDKWHKRIAAAKSGLYIPPSDKYETIAVPGALGGVNFGNTAADPTKGMVYILAQEYPSVYKLEKIKAPTEMMSKDDVLKAKTLYASTCKSCHGENMTGAGIAPSIVNAGQRMGIDDFKGLLAAGRGQMPGFAHIQEEQVTAIYRFLGGNPAMRVGFGRKNDSSKMPEGPVVASGGAKVNPDARVVAPMSDYPEDVEHPQDRYTTDYGTFWPGLLNPKWSRVMAYDLNTGTVKWEHTIGEDTLALNKETKNLGTPGGAQRKGMVVTSNGVLFCTAKGGKLYAFDSDKGKLLWETTLSHESNAQPMMYEIKGKQYLVVNATSNFGRDGINHAKKPGALPRGYVVYALPDKK
ncbi:outer membrane protein assembly factor BamB family protein [Adhaeribacter radiodurans]|uniref:PQQ-binding-like beta-propeller repeat protein n=1 Tax=Adhaeribacter radiodurans TaxID=2745197 RepID=A0A7L7L2Z8_9BACT|nr:PQQ-binding-like beta-propeller repeat protein [Adhaeribacter radiodurans]QMU27133.1 PQQ-binding-like beta-propeller repeat protein [Adhaeribacter radiodurans]